MLNKLIKHEFSQTGRTFLPMFGGTCVLLLLAKLLILLGEKTAVVEMRNGAMEATGGGIVMFLIGIFIAILILALMALVIGTLLISVQRFYKLLGDEGYAMFTLPVTPAQHIWAKAIVATVWTLASILFSVLCVIVLTSMPLSVISEAFGELTAELGMGTGLYLMLMGVALIAGIVNVLWLAYMSCAIGMHWPQQRLIASILAFFGIQMVLQILSSIVMVGLGTLVVTNEQLMQQLGAWAETNPLSTMSSFMGFAIVFSLVTSAVFFLVTRNRLNKHLELA